MIAQVNDLSISCRIFGHLSKCNQAYVSALKGETKNGEDGKRYTCSEHVSMLMLAFSSKHLRAKEELHRAASMAVDSSLKVTFKHSKN